jgi:hypothetical protein
MVIFSLAPLPPAPTATPPVRHTLQANLTKIIGPYAYTVLFGKFGQYSPFLVGSLFIALSEVLQRQVAWDELDQKVKQKKAA